MPTAPVFFSCFNNQTVWRKSFSIDRLHPFNCRRTGQNVTHTNTDDTPRDRRNTQTHRQRESERLDCGGRDGQTWTLATFAVVDDDVSPPLGSKPPRRVLRRCCLGSQSTRGVDRRRVRTRNDAEKKTGERLKNPTHTRYSAPFQIRDGPLFLFT